MLTRKSIILACTFITSISSIALAKEETEDCQNWKTGDHFSQCITNCIRARCNVVHINDPKWCETKCGSIHYHVSEDRDGFWDKTATGGFTPEVRREKMKKDGMSSIAGQNVPLGNFTTPILDWLLK